MKPSLGRIVLYTLPSDHHPVNQARTFPAIITAVHSDTMVNLRVFADGSSVMMEWVTSVPYADQPGEPFTWAWPPRV